MSAEQPLRGYGFRALGLDNPYRMTRDVVGAVEPRPAPGAVLRIGTADAGMGSWEQTAYVILDPEEARALAAAIIAATEASETAHQDLRARREQP